MLAEFRKKGESRFPALSAGAADGGTAEAKERAEKEKANLKKYGRAISVFSC